MLDGSGINVSFKISWDLEGVRLPPAMADRDLSALGFPGDFDFLKTLVKNFYNQEGVNPPDGNVLTVGGSQGWWYGYKGDESGKFVITNFTEILNDNSHYKNNKITDLVPMLYGGDPAGCDNLSVKTDKTIGNSNDVLNNWKKMMESLLQNNINYYFIFF